MKTSPSTFLRAAPNLLLGAMFVFVPFYALITVWLGTTLGGYSIWRVIPEITLLALGVVAAITMMQEKNRPGTLFRDRLLQVCLAYIGILVVYGMVSYFRGDVGARAILQGMVMDLRLPVAFLAAYLVAPRINGVEGKLWRWILWPAVGVVVFGLLQTFVLPPDTLRHVGYGPTTVPAVTLVDQKADFPRVQSTLRGPNPLGAYLIIILSALTVALVKSRKRWQATVFGLAAAVVLIYTYSRSAYIGAFIGVAGICWLLAGRYRRWLLVASGLLVIIFITSLVLLRNNDQFQNVFFHTDETSRSSRSSNQDRASALHDGFIELAHDPVGRGVGTAGPSSVYSGEGTRITENYYLQIGQETGWLGLALFLGFTGLIAYRLWSYRRNHWAIVLLASGVGLVVVNCLSHAWTDPTLAYVWWLAAGLTIGSGILSSESPNKHAKKTTQRL
ncbi:MAG: rane protein of unknown function [Candidatus Saccharibacteria bacterium]|nr:rane protein of unknown function [Candidatus Saccharibacteria bacterium]